MTYSRTCEKCNESFYTGNSQDKICMHCDGTTPRLKYYELDKHEN